MKVFVPMAVLALAAADLRNLRGAPAEAEDKPGHAVQEPSAVDLESTGVSGVTCEKWVTCKDGFFGNIRCSGTRYCKVCGPAARLRAATCEKWVTCKDGFFGNIRCSGTRYCEVWGPQRLQFEEEAPEAAEKTEQSADSTVDEPSAVDLESTGVSGVTCEKWVTCKDGFFGNIRCSGTRYCEVWRPRRLQFEEEAPEEAEKTEQPADSTVQEPSAVDFENTGVSGATCEKWVTCKDGFFGNIRCSGTRYCEVWGPAQVPHGATCKKWVTCKDGFFGNIRCSGTRYCEAWR